jgi:hypothetical protein
MQLDVEARGEPAWSRIRCIRAESFAWPKMLGELIDNSIGNGATEVDVEFVGERLTVRDNGVGCDQEMFAALVSFGWHQEDKRQRNLVSRYGVGAKTCFVSLGGPTQLWSLRDDICLHREVRWDSFQDSWNYAKAVTGPQYLAQAKSHGMDYEHGLLIVMPAITRGMGEKRLAKLTKSLNDTYWAAIENGVSITVTWRKSAKEQLHGGRLTGVPLPTFIPEHRVDRDVTLPDGRRIHVFAGIMDRTVKAQCWPGFNYIYGHRVVLANSRLGCGTAANDCVYGRVRLLGDKHAWNVSTHKDGLREDDQDALDAAVSEACRDLLAHAQSEAFSQFEDNELLKEVELCLNDSFGQSLDGKLEKRTRTGAKNDKPPSEPKDTGRKRRRAEKHDDTKAGSVTHAKNGEALTKPDRRKRAESIRLQWVAPKEGEEDSIGYADIVGRAVCLNREHRFLANARDAKNMSAIFAVAVLLWVSVSSFSDASGQKRFFTEHAGSPDKAILMRVSSLLAHANNAPIHEMEEAAT